MAVPRLQPTQTPGHRRVADEAPSVADRRQFVCDSCGKTFQGYPVGAGLLVWTRGDETRFEEPPLCERCAEKIAVGALVKWSLEGEEG
jgi:hypothetical protein